MEEDMMDKKDIIRISDKLCGISMALEDEKPKLAKEILKISISIEDVYKSHK